MKKIILVILIIAVMMLLTACLPGDLDETDEPAGLFWGILHGWLAPVSLFISLFKEDVKMYEVFNTGFWYNLGFYMAIISGFGGLSLSRSRNKNKD